MAEDLPPNLDDGELWLPSDVIRAVGVCRHHHRRVPVRLAPFPEDCGAMDDLAQKFASFGLLERRRAIHAVKPFRGFPLKPELHGQGRPVFLLSPSSAGYKVPLGQRAAEANAVSGGGGGTGAFFPVSRTAHKFHPGIPVDCQDEKFQLERARVFQRQQHPGHGLNRYVVPARSSGSGRESGGTGVFLPRIAAVESKKKPLSVKGSVQLHHRQPMWNPMSGKPATKLLPSADMGLPHDWTY